jgi:hypothetical protein
MKLKKLINKMMGIRREALLEMLEEEGFEIQQIINTKGYTTLTKGNQLILYDEERDTIISWSENYRRRKC